MIPQDKGNTAQVRFALSKTKHNKYGTKKIKYVGGFEHSRI